MAKNKAIEAVELPADGLLMWDRPKRAHSKEEWKEGYGFDGGPTGGYMPNMSDDDARRWKAKLVGTKTGFPQVEIRKQAGPSLMTIIVNLGAGYAYKGRTPAYDVEKARTHYVDSTRMKPMSLVDRIALQEVSAGTNVHMSMNGPALMDFQDMADMSRAIEEARAVLLSLETAPGERSLLHVDVAEGHDAASVAAELATIQGVRSHLVLPEERFVVLSVVATALPAIAAVEGVARTRGKDEFDRDGRRALNVAYGFPADDGEDEA